MILHLLQKELESIYRIGRQPSIERFLISAQGPPRIVVAEREREILVGVELGPEAREPENLADFLSAAEETSHFLYISWKAANEKPVSLLDVEVQGEIDKFLLASLHFPAPPEPLDRLLERVRFDPRPAATIRRRYLEAHRLGRKFLQSLGRIFGPRGPLPEVLAVLREFYRRTSPVRLAAIARL